jgi:hypothetical protein
MLQGVLLGSSVLLFFAAVVIYEAVSIVMMQQTAIPSVSTHTSSGLG